MTSQDVADLVRRSRAGDDGAFRDLLLRHQSAISSTLFACGVRCRETARDLAQDVALKAWQGLERLADPGTFSAWIRQIAANSARDHLRRRAVRGEEELPEDYELEAKGDDPHRLLERERELRLMLAALAGEDRQLVAMLLAREDGATVEELDPAGEATSSAALKMRLSRARKRLRARLAELRRS